MGSFNTKLEQTDMNQSKDVLLAMHGWIKSKLEKFEMEVEQELLQTGGTKATGIPIIDKDSDVFVKDQSHKENAVSSCIEGAIGKLITGNWKPAITDVLKGGLNVFLGPKQAINEGTMQEHRGFHFVWSDALLRIDIYVLRFNISTESDYKKHAEFFAGYMLIKSIVDINKVSPQLLSYEIVNFLNAERKLKDENGKMVYENFKAVLLEIISQFKKKSQRNGHDYKDQQDSFNTMPSCLPLEAVRHDHNLDTSLPGKSFLVSEDLGVQFEVNTDNPAIISQNEVPLVDTVESIGLRRTQRQRRERQRYGERVYPDSDMVKPLYSDIVKRGLHPRKL